jgi:AraC-like DNA-binding protein
MLDLSDIDMMARGGSLALLGLLGWLLFRDHRTALPARMALLMLAAIFCHIMATVTDVLFYPIIFNWLFVFGSALVPGAFWLFARTWFNDEVEIDMPSLLLVLLPPALFATALLVFGRTNPFFIVGMAMRVLSFGFATAGLWAAWRGRDGDLVEARRRIRALMIWAVGGFVIVVNIAEILVNTRVGPAVLGTWIEIGIMLLTGGLCGMLLRVSQADLFASVRTDSEVPARELRIDTALALRLTRYMDTERAWRDDTLTIAKLATALGTQEYQLRRLINGSLGHRNFAAFLSGYRLAEVRAALSDPSQVDVPILTIALDAGFGSLGPFNRAFREAEGCTPSEFRRAA